MGRARILAGAFVVLTSAAFLPMGCSGNQVGSVTATHKGGVNQSSYLTRRLNDFETAWRNMDRSWEMGITHSTRMLKWVKMV